MSVAVVGAGISGLCAAYDLMRAGVDVTVLESERRAGGVIVTERPAAGWIVEGGPDGFHDDDSAVPDLAKDLGIANRLVPAAARGAFTWDGRGFAPLSGAETTELLGLTAPKSATAGYRTFAGGMGELVDALVAALGDRIRYRVGVTGLTRTRAGFRLAATGGTAVDGAGVVLALPAYSTARLCRTLDQGLPGLLEHVRYRPSLNVSLAYARARVAGRLEGSGFVVKSEVATELRACTYASLKFAGRAPADGLLVRAFLSWGVEDAGAVAHRALAPILTIAGDPQWTRTFAWPRGLASPHLNEAVDRRLARLGAIALAGPTTGTGSSLAACVRSGREAARRLTGS